MVDYQSEPGHSENCRKSAGVDTERAAAEMFCKGGSFDCRCFLVVSSSEQLLGHSFEHCLAHLKYLQSTLNSDFLIEQSLLVSLDYAEWERVELDITNKEQRSEQEKPQLATVAA